MWFRVVLLVGLALGAATPASAQTWTACYDAATDSLTPDGHQAVRAAAAAHRADTGSFEPSLGWRGIEILAGRDHLEPDQRAVHRTMTELRRLGVSRGRLHAEGLAASDASLTARDECMTLSLAHVPVLAWHHPPIYFARNSSAIDERGRRALEGLAADYQAGWTRVTVDGHDDTAKSTSQSRRTSELRTMAVVDALVRLGVRWTDIQQRSWGEQRLARPTADGVAELLNRRVMVEADRPRARDSQ